MYCVRYRHDFLSSKSRTTSGSYFRGKPIVKVFFNYFSFQRVLSNVTVHRSASVLAIKYLLECCVLFKHRSILLYCHCVFNNNVVILYIITNKSFVILINLGIGSLLSDM